MLSSQLCRPLLAQLSLRRSTAVKHGSKVCCRTSVFARKKRSALHVQASALPASAPAVMDKRPGSVQRAMGSWFTVQPVFADQSAKATNLRLSAARVQTISD